MVSTVISAADRLPPLLRKAAPYVLLALAVLLVYSNIYGNEFVYDDGSLIVGNAFLQSWHFLGAIFTSSAFAGATSESHYYRPLQILLYLVINQAAGLSLFGFHFLNVALHAANACLLYVIGRKLEFNPVAVFLAVLIWAVHPLQVEAVTYMSGTADPLYAFFGLWALLVLLPDFAPRRIWLAVPLLILCLLSKEEAVTFPLLAMSCLFYVSAQRYELKTYIRLWPLALIVGIYVAAHFAFEAQSSPAKMAAGAIEHSQKIHGLYLAPPPYTCFAALAAYIKLLIVPAHLHYDRSFPFYTEPWHFEVVAGVAIFLFAFYQVFWRQERRNLPLSWGILWFAAAYFLHSGIPLTFDRPVLEHLMYLPSAGLFLGLGETMALILAEPKAQKFRTVNIAAALLLAFIWGLKSYHQNEVWRDSETLYLNIFRNGETSPNAHTNLGVLYSSRGEYDKALDQYQLAIRLSGDTIPEAQYHFALDLLAEPGGRTHIKDAIAHLKRALDIDPGFYYANQKLAELYDRTGDKTNAALYRNRARDIRAKLMQTAP